MTAPATAMTVPTLTAISCWKAVFRKTALTVRSQLFLTQGRLSLTRLERLSHARGWRHRGPDHLVAARSGPETGELALGDITNDWGPSAAPNGVTALICQPEIS